MTPKETFLDNQHLLLVKIFIFIGVEDGSGVTSIFVIGMYSDVSLGVPG